MRSKNLLASSATVDGLCSVISRFYGGEGPVSLQDGGAVVKRGTVVPGVRWRLQRGRYRFETTDQDQQ